SARAMRSRQHLLDLLREPIESTTGNNRRTTCRRFVEVTTHAGAEGFLHDVTVCLARRDAVVVDARCCLEAVPRRRKRVCSGEFITDCVRIDVTRCAETWITIGAVAANQRLGGIREVGWHPSRFAQQHWALRRVRALRRRDFRYGTAVVALHAQVLFDSRYIDWESQLSRILLFVRIVASGARNCHLVV